MSSLNSDLLLFAADVTIDVGDTAGGVCFAVVVVTVEVLFLFCLSDSLERLLSGPTSSDARLAAISGT